MKPRFENMKRGIIVPYTLGRSYSFMAFKDTTNDHRENSQRETREPCEVVYKLWSATLSPAEKNKKSP